MELDSALLKIEGSNLESSALEECWPKRRKLMKKNQGRCGIQELFIFSVLVFLTVEIT